MLDLLPRCYRVGCCARSAVPRRRRLRSASPYDCRAMCWLTFGPPAPAGKAESMRCCAKPASERDARCNRATALAPARHLHENSWDIPGTLSLAARMTKAMRSSLRHGQRLGARSNTRYRRLGACAARSFPRPKSPVRTSPSTLADAAPRRLARVRVPAQIPAELLIRSARGLNSLLGARVHSQWTITVAGRRWASKDAYIGCAPRLPGHWQKRLSGSQRYRRHRAILAHEQ